MVFIRKKIFHLILAVLCASAFSPAAAQAQCRIVILKSWDLPEYNTALVGFHEALRQLDPQCESATYNLKGGAEATETILNQIRSFRPNVIFTVGSRATAVASKTFDDVPIVFSMVLYPVASGFVKNMDRPGGNVTGAAIDIPLRNQFRLLARIVPNLKRVGVLYSPEETQPVVEEAKRVAQSMGIDLLAEKVMSETDVPEALKRLERQNIQALWSVADGKVFTPQSTQYIIEQALRNDLPFMGPHSGFTRAGALVALTPDYEDNGRQAGEIAIRIINGANPATIPVATPRNIEMALNLRVANYIRLRLSQELIDEANQVFE